MCSKFTKHYLVQKYFGTMGSISKFFTSKFNSRHSKCFQSSISSPVGLLAVLKRLVQKMHSECIWFIPDTCVSLFRIISVQVDYSSLNWNNGNVHEESDLPPQHLEWVRVYCFWYCLPTGEIHNYVLRRNWKLTQRIYRVDWLNSSPSSRRMFYFYNHFC